MKEDLLIADSKWFKDWILTIKDIPPKLTIGDTNSDYAPPSEFKTVIQFQLGKREFWCVPLYHDGSSCILDIWDGTSDILPLGLLYLNLSILSLLLMLQDKRYAQIKT